MSGFHWNFDNKFFTELNKLIDMFLLSLIFVVSCIPVFTIGAASTAMYYTVNKVLKRKMGYMWREYRTSFVANFKQATEIWLGFLVIGAIMGIDFFILRGYALEGYAWGKLYGVFFVLFVAELAVWMYVYPNIARFENTNRQIIKNAELMAVIHLPQTLLMMVIAVALAFLVYVWPVTALIVPSIYIGIKNLILERIFRKYMSPEDVEKEEACDQSDISR